MMTRFAPLARLWQSRSQQEQTLLMSMAGIVVLWLTVTLIWQPLMTARGDLGIRIARHDRAIATLLSNPVSAGPTVSPETRPLAIIITETTVAFQLTIRRLEPEGASVRVFLEEAPFDAVILCLEALARDQGIRVSDVELIRRPAPGVVNATLTLGR